MALPYKSALALQRVRDELDDQPKSGRAFASNQLELELIDVNRKGWIAQLRDDVRAERYVPGPIETVFAPKGRGLVRPGVRLSIADRVVYTAAVGACLRKIHTATKWSQKRIDFAPRINPAGLTHRHWLLSYFRAWEAWRDESVERLDQKKTKFVISADIAEFFENVSINLLRSELARIGCAAEAVALIGTCLNKWAATPDRGLPQGVLASDLLAKLYLESLDRTLKADGFVHVRYADDIRMFCTSETEARRALVRLTDLLRDRGLTLQSAKTKIRPAGDEIRADFEGAVPVIQRLQREYIDGALAAGLMRVDPSMPISVIDDLANQDPTKLSPAFIRRAFRQLVLEQSAPNRTVVHYLLRRLAGRQDDYAVDYCRRILLDAPEETPAILRYFGDLSDPGLYEADVVKVLKRKDLAMYPYQRYLVLEWLLRHATRLRKPTIQTLRSLVQDARAPSYVVIRAQLLLGKFGDHADIEGLARAFAQATDALERAQLLASLARLERSRRNAILARVRDEAPSVCRAVHLVRAV